VTEVMVNGPDDVYVEREGPTTLLMRRPVRPAPVEHLGDGPQLGSTSGRPAPREGGEFDMVLGNAAGCMARLLSMRGHYARENRPFGS
jgi:hypothetical protein